MSLSILPNGMTIRICGHDYTYGEEDPGTWNPSKWGWGDAHKGVIHIRSDMTLNIKQSTLLHEVMHQIAQLYDLENSKVGDEVWISVSAVALMQFIKDNPVVVDWLSTNG